jgi:hypothetical protein
LIILITPHIVSGKSGDELTKREKERIRRAVIPLRLGDVDNINEGVKGEIFPYKKKNDK